MIFCYQSLDDPNLRYNSFFKIFSDSYNKNFPLKEYTLKNKDIITPWMSKGLKKSSKLKQKLYIKYLKKKSTHNEVTYKNYKNLFEKIKIRSKNNDYSSLRIKHQNNSKKIWQVMKEITGKLKIDSGNFPKTLKHR